MQNCGVSCTTCSATLTPMGTSMAFGSAAPQGSLGSVGPPGSHRGLSPSFLSLQHPQVGQEQSFWAGCRDRGRDGMAVVLLRVALVGT